MKLTISLNQTIESLNKKNISEINKKYPRILDMLFISGDGQSDEITYYPSKTGNYVPRINWDTTIVPYQLKSIELV
jgi:hypothetical protein